MNRHCLRLRRQISTAAAVAFVSMMMAPAAYASGSSMPWEAPLQSILESIEGPVAKIIAVMIIIITGLTLAFGDTSGGAAKAIDRPKTIWISRRNPPEVSPKASARPVEMMMITEMILATGPWMDSRID